MPEACDGYRPKCFTTGYSSGGERIVFCDFSPPPWGRPSSEVSIYLWVPVIVTFVAEATGTVRMIVADHVCHFLTVAGCMRQARSSYSSRNFESTTHKRRKLTVNRGRGRLFEAICCLQAVSWLSTASSLAASTALEQRIARRKVRAYWNVSQTQTRRL